MTVHLLSYYHTDNVKYVEVTLPCQRARRNQNQENEAIDNKFSERKVRVRQAGRPIVARYSCTGNRIDRLDVYR